MKAKHVGAQLRKAISGILAAAMVMTSITVPTYAKVDEEVIEIETEGEGLEASDAVEEEAVVENTAEKVATVESGAAIEADAMDSYTNDFSADPEGSVWMQDATGGSEAAYDKDNQCVNIKVGGSGWNSSDYLGIYIGTMKAGTYSASVKIKSDQGGDWPKLKYQAGSGDWTSLKDSAEAVGSEYVTLEGVFELESDSEIKLFINVNSNGGHTLSIDDVKIEPSSPIESSSTKLYFYYAPTDTEIKTLGAVFWGDVFTVDTDVNKETSVEPWGGSEAYTLKAVEKNAGWYELDLTYPGTGSCGFGIYPITLDGEEEKAGDVIKEYKAGVDLFDDAIIVPDITKAAVRFSLDGKSSDYVTGTDADSTLVTSYMNQVTMYVYDDTENRIPALYQWGTDNKLQYVKIDTDNEVADLTPSYSNIGNNFFDLEDASSAIGKNWYKITFIVDTEKTGKIFQLVRKDTTQENEYKWDPNTEFSYDGTAGTNAKVMLTDNYVYYKDDEFSLLPKSDDPTLANLQSKIAEAKTEVAKTDEYTAASIKDLNDAIDSAEAVVKEHEEDPDTTTGEDITDSFNALVVAISYLSDDFIKDGGSEAGNGKAWTVDKGTNSDDVSFKDVEDVIDGNYQFSIGVKTSETVLSQKVSVIPAGSYIMTAKARDHWNNDGIADGVIRLFVGDESKSFNITEYKKNCDFTFRLDIDEELTNVSVGVGVSTNLSDIDWFKVDDISLKVKAPTTLGELKALIDEKGYWDSYNEELFEKGYAEFKSAYAAATSTYVKYESSGESTTNDEISKAFTDLSNAIDDVVEAVVSLGELTEYIKDVKDSYNDASLYTEASYENLQKAIASANAVVEDADVKADPTTPDNLLKLKKAYDAIVTAINDLKSKTESDIQVTKVNGLAEDFMAGADLSSFIALREAGTVFKDLSGNALNDQEFFDYLAAGGTNYVRIRVWNDPYDSNGNGYGGGNNDVDKAIKIGKLATLAGMKVLIDFHYSDFWVDPSKYKAPKAWKNLDNLDKAKALYDFTYDSLDKIVAAGVDVGMVQIGNEANHGIAEETDGAATIMYGYGCDAVDTINEENDINIIKAVHFTDIQDGGGTVLDALTNQLKNNKYYSEKNQKEQYVAYDAVGVSYYPMLGHGNISNLGKVIDTISAGYGPGGSATKVFVAETSYPTTWEDGDGFSNQGPAIKGQDISQYPISMQGQADMMRAIANALTEHNGLGMFYWEPAWISPYQACYEDYSVNPTLYAKNQKAWEQYGAGWASSYAYEYDPTDAGLYYGGSSMDNQSWFDFDGTALPLVNIYKYIKQGCTSTKLDEVGEVRYNQKTGPYNLGTAVDDIIKAITVEVYRNNGAKETLPTEQLVWNQSDILKIDTDKAGFYYIYGKTVVDGKTWPIACEIEITGDNNVILSNGNFDDIEDSTGQRVKFTDWDMYGLTNREESPVKVIDYTTPFSYDKNKYSINNENAKSGNALNFYYANRNLDLTLYQKVGKIGKGSYTFGGYIEGKSGGEYDQQFAVAYVYESEDQFKEDLAEVYSDPTGHRLGDNAKRRYSSSVQFAGWKNWQKPEIKDIIVEEDDYYVVVGFQINGVPSGTWGSVDDAYMYGNYGVKLETVENGSLTASNFFPGSNQSVSVTARHDKGYKLASITVSGNGVTSDCFTSENGWSVADKVATYNATADDQSQDSVTVRFTMPKSEVSVSANFESLFKKDEKININDATVSSIGGKKYTGEEEFFTNGTKKVEPYVALEYNGYKLTSSDFTAQYASDCNKVGTFEITITGKGKFEGTRKLTYKLIEETRKDISVKDALTFVFAEKATDNIIFARVNGVVKNGADGKDPEYYYNGLDIKPIVTVKYGDTTLTPDTDYTVAYEKNNKVGTATMTIVGKNGYKGSVDKKFKIVKADFKVLIANDDEGKVTGPIVVNRNNTISATTWDEKGAQPNIGIWYGSIMLRAGKDYSVSFKNNKKISDDKTKVSVTITGKGNYTGKWEKEFKVIPKNLSDNGIEVIAEDLVENKNRALKPKFVVATTEKHKSIGDKNYTYKVLDKDGKEVELSNLKSKGEYTLVITGKNYYQGTIKADFRVIDKDHIITKSNVSFGKIYYQGKAIKLGDGLVISENSVGKVADNSIRIKVGTKVLSANDFEIASYEKNSGAGKARVVIKGKGDYAGQVVTTFSINKLKLVDYDKYAALVKDNKAMGYATVNAKTAEDLQDLMKEDTTYKKRQVYTGYTKTPEFTVNVLINGEEEAIDFTPTKDYKIQYANNVNPGKVEAGGVEYEGKTYKKGTGVKTTFSGKGNFSGSSVYKDAFFIEPRTVDDLDVSVENATYEGKQVKAEVKFVDIATGSRVYLNPSKCYSVSYKNNNMISRILGKEPHVVVKMKGYAASADKNKNTRKFDFIISAGTITMNSMDVIKAQKYNNGKPVTPKVKVVVNGKTLKENVDYIIEYANNYDRYAAESSIEGDAATPKATVIGIGNYTGTAYRYFTIK